MFALEGSIRLAGSVVFIAILCSGCVTAISPSDAARVQTISLSGFNEPGFDALDFLILTPIPARPSGYDEFPTLMERQSLHLGTELAAAIAQGLRNDGYKVVEGGSANADATLDVQLLGFPPAATALYAAHGGDFEPEFTAVATLTDSSTKKTLFRGAYVYRNNSLKPIDGTILIRPDPKYYFKTSKALFDNPQLAAEGFRAAEPIIAQLIAASLKR
ncbi:MAG TPA: hypothetical protein VEU06_05225 [Micropepsaceae bacterium]|nr:hypothetical protein [Micropepsaceae bacterium]